LAENLNIEGFIENRTRQKYLAQRILLIILSVAISAIVIEGLFTVFGFMAESAIKKIHKGNSNAFKILCLGDSSTYGQGSSDAGKFSYPSQLQKLLDENGLCSKFEVINLGLPGINSSKILNGLEKNILTYRPDMVIVMAGINDPWSLEDSNIIKFYNATPLRRRFLKLELALNKLHLYRFLRLVLISKVFTPHTKFITPSWVPFDEKKGFAFSANDPERSQALYYCLNYNITEMARIAADRHITILFMNYHNGGWGHPEIALDKVYARLNIPIIDNYTTFIKAQKDGLNVRGSDGWHPNDFGYSLIAKNVYDRILSLNISKKCAK
jgi:lysophospholipase L1-like esterase